MLFSKLSDPTTLEYRLAIMSYFNANPTVDMLSVGDEIQTQYGPKKIEANFYYVKDLEGNPQCIMEQENSFLGSGGSANVYKGVGIFPPHDEYAIKKFKEKYIADNTKDIEDEHKMFNLFYQQATPQEKMQAVLVTHGSSVVMVSPYIPGAVSLSEFINPNMGILRNKLFSSKETTKKPPTGSFAIASIAPGEKIPTLADTDPAAMLTAIKNANHMDFQPLVNLQKLIKLFATISGDIKTAYKAVERNPEEKDASFPFVAPENFDNTFDKLLDISIKWAELMQKAHEKNIILADQKPDNAIVFVDNNGANIKLIDFGGAVLCKPEDNGFIASDQITGSPYYLTPNNQKIYKAYDFLKLKLAVLQEFATLSPDVLAVLEKSLSEKEKVLYYSMKSSLSEEMPKFTLSFNTDMYALGHSLEQTAEILLKIPTNDFGDLPYSFVSDENAAQAEKVNQFVKLTKTLKGVATDRPSDLISIIALLKDMRQNNAPSLKID